MLGRLGQTTAKARKHPEQTIVNRYRESVNATAAVHDNSAAAPDAEIGAEDEEQNLELAPACGIKWPHVNANNRKLLENNTRPDKLHLPEVRIRNIHPILGATICNPMRLATPDEPDRFELRKLVGGIKIGRRKFNTMEREDAFRVQKSRASWFSIKAKHVPHYFEWLQQTVDEEQLVCALDSIIYGRVLHFAELKLSWHERPFYLAHCMLYRPQPEPHHPTGYSIINTTKQQLYVKHSAAAEDAQRIRFRKREDDGYKPVEYVQVQHIIDMVAVAPRYPVQPPPKPAPDAKSIDAQQHRVREEKEEHEAAVKLADSEFFVLPLTV
jgi:hypothetical protein